MERNSSVKSADPFEKRIIGGWETSRKYFPYHVGLVESNYILGMFRVWRYVCGGTLLDVKWVLTAAHCFFVKGQRLETFDVGVALREELSSYRYQWLKNLITRVDAVVIYPRYNKETLHGSDIALTRLVTPAEYSFILRPALLPKEGSLPPVNTQFCIAGWGITNASADGTVENKDQLQATCLIVHDYTCQKSKRPGQNFCGNVPGKRIGPCTGDSGGGAVIKREDGRFIVIGIVSMHMAKCHQKGNPDIMDIFTNVGWFVDWINKIRTYY